MVTATKNKASLPLGFAYPLGNIGVVSYSKPRETMYPFYEAYCESHGFQAMERPPWYDKIHVYESQELRLMAKQIRQEIETLRNADGINILMETLGEDFFSSLKKIQKPRPSQLVVDDDFRITLPDYGIEIKMSRLPKVLYFLFLRHPEGVRLKELFDYRDELFDLYRKVSNIENPLLMQRSIDDLTDLGSNSLNEKMSRIRKAFFDSLSDGLAMPYIPCGSRGEAKKISLPREKIVLPKGL